MHPNFSNSQGTGKKFEKSGIRKIEVFLEKGRENETLGMHFSTIWCYQLYSNSKNVRFIIEEKTIKHLSFPGFPRIAPRNQTSF